MIFLMIVTTYHTDTITFHRGRESEQQVPANGFGWRGETGEGGSKLSHAARSHIWPGLVQGKGS